ncbi:outer mitochondrial transmembrane helix translocase-like isoform X2 [Dermacentor albipictus]|uniref:outer mitochondrial transmembrane helix translocase-like isoform X2 n=1 Tax=Dermacentor albipictus TaxID=60249 RepID=UPI0031FC945E
MLVCLVMHTSVGHSYCGKNIIQSTLPVSRALHSARRKIYFEWIAVRRSCNSSRAPLPTKFPTIAAQHFQFHGYAVLTRVPFNSQCSTAHSANSNFQQDVHSVHRRGRTLSTALTREALRFSFCRRNRRARFINLEVAALTDKWYGESQKLASAVFTLAVKIQPCIIFIDEIDSFLRSRDSQDHEATAMMKAQFMCLWDGLITDPDCQVVVMGATNRPHDVDKAILRRMPAMFHVGLPNQQQRAGIIKLVLETEGVSKDVNIMKIARLTEGFSGSDLRELCRNAALYRVRDLLRIEKHQGGVHKEVSDDEETFHDARQSGAKEGSDDDETFHDALRPICMEDFTNALAKMKNSKVLAHQRHSVPLELD